MTGLAGLEAFANSDSRLRRLWTAVEREASHDAAHDVWHFRRVAAGARRLASSDLDPVLVVAAGLVHDIVHVPKNSPLRAQASELSAARASTLLLESGFAEADAEAVAEAVRDHSWSRGKQPSTPLGCLLQDADRLEALGAVGLMRCIATGVSMGGTMFDPQDPFAADRELDDRHHSVDHVFVKLLKLPATFTTETGRREAEHRADWLVAFLKQFSDEIGVPIPAHRMPRQPRDET